MSDRALKPACLDLMRELSVSYLRNQRSLFDQMRSEDIDVRAGAFRNFYQGYLPHLARDAGFDFEKMIDFRNNINTFSAKVFGEFNKAVSIKKEGDNAYRLAPVGFLSVFRGRAGINDCSFDMDYGLAFTRAMHSSTLYYFVYRGSKLKGYIGLCLAKTADGNKILALDTVQSPAFNSPEIMGRLMQKLHIVAKELGCVGLAAPAWDIMRRAFNFHNEPFLAALKMYQNGVPVHVKPMQEKEWGKFTDVYGQDQGNTIEDGRYVLLKTDEGLAVSENFEQGSEQSEAMMALGWAPADLMEPIGADDGGA
jgi:hypothetical protein